MEDLKAILKMKLVNKLKTTLKPNFTEIFAQSLRDKLTNTIQFKFEDKAATQLLIVNVEKDFQRKFYHV